MFSLYTLLGVLLPPVVLFLRVQALFSCAVKNSEGPVFHVWALGSAMLAYPSVKTHSGGTSGTSADGGGGATHPSRAYLAGNAQLCRQLYNPHNAWGFQR